MSKELFPAQEIDPERHDPAKLTTVNIRLTVNTHTYASVEGIMQEIAESLDWLIYDHDAIFSGEWDVITE